MKLKFKYHLFKTYSLVWNLISSGNCEYETKMSATSGLYMWPYGKINKNIFFETMNLIEPKLCVMHHQMVPYKYYIWIEIQDGHHHRRKFNIGPFRENVFKIYFTGIWAIFKKLPRYAFMLQFLLLLWSFIYIRCCYISYTVTKKNKGVQMRNLEF